MAPPLFTCEAVLSEAQFLLNDRGGDPRAVLDWVRVGVLNIAFGAEDEMDRLMALQRSYRSFPMDFADACLVRMAELHRRASVLTTDSHFKIYRRNGRQVIPLIAPWL